MSTAHPQHNPTNHDDPKLLEKSRDMFGGFFRQLEDGYTDGNILNSVITEEIRKKFLTRVPNSNTDMRTIVNNAKTFRELAAGLIDNESNTSAQTFDETADKLYAASILDGQLIGVTTKPANNNTFFELTKIDDDHYKFSIYPPAIKMILANPSFLEGANKQVLDNCDRAIIKQFGVTKKDDSSSKFQVIKNLSVTLGNDKDAKKATDTKQIIGPDGKVTDFGDGRASTVQSNTHSNPAAAEQNINTGDTLKQKFEKVIEEKGAKANDMVNAHVVRALKEITDDEKIIKIISNAFRDDWTVDKLMNEIFGSWKGDKKTQITPPLRKSAEKRIVKKQIQETRIPTEDKLRKFLSARIQTMTKNELRALKRQIIVNKIKEVTENKK